MGIADFLKKKKEAQAIENKQAGEAFLQENKEKEGIIVTDSGLQYEILEKGSGKQPGANDSVTCHYEGKLLNGKVFDSSVKRGQPATFALSRVISGWTEGLQYMTEGSKFRFYIPAHLAYGNAQVASIPPFSTLVFEVSLLKVS